MIDRLASLHRTALVATTLLLLLAIACAGPARARATGVQPRIINGAATSESSFAARWPWMAAVVGSMDSGSTLCGGVVIDSRTVLTAAHCTYAPGGWALSASSIDVVVGRRVASSGAGDRIGLHSITRHPSFSAATMRHDVAVLRLARAPLQPYAALQPTSAADESWWGAGSGRATGDDLVGPWTAGWGATHPSGSAFPDALHEAKVPIASDPACRTPRAPGHGSFVDTSTMLCAGVPATTAGAGVDTCQGDSGGPLIVGDGTGRWRLVGLTSWGLDCGGAYYGVYTRVGRYVDWIEPLRFEPSPTPPTPTSPPVPDPAPTPAPGTAQPPASASDDGSGSGSSGGGSGPSPTASAAGPIPIEVVADPSANRRPTMPLRPRAWRPARGVVVLTWRPSRDDVRVVRYRVLVRTVRGWRLRATTSRTRLRIPRVRSGQRLLLRVQALDGAGLRSRASAVVRVRAR